MSYAFKRADEYQREVETGTGHTVFLDDLRHMRATLDCGGDVNFHIKGGFASLDPHEVVRLHEALGRRIAEYGNTKTSR